MFGLFKKQKILIAYFCAEKYDFETKIATNVNGLFEKFVDKLFYIPRIGEYISNNGHKFCVYNVVYTFNNNQDITLIEIFVQPPRK